MAAPIKFLKLKLFEVILPNYKPTVKVWELVQALKQTFPGQIIKEFNKIEVAYGDISYAAQVIELKLLGGEASDRRVLSGKYTEKTGVKFEVVPSLVSVVEGAELSPQVFDSRFDLNNLSKSLAEFGIGGLSTESTEMLFEGLAIRMIHPAERRRRGLKCVKGILLYGPPGTGKTLIARNIGKILKTHEPKVINGPEVKSHLSGKGEEKIRDLFQSAFNEEKRLGSQSQLHLIIFDEFDSIARTRGAAEGLHQYDDSIVNQLLSMIDGVNELNNVLIIATTNRRDLIDPALLREGRIELKIEVALPKKEGRLEILQVHTKNLVELDLLTDDVDLDSLARSTKGFSGATLASVVSRANGYALLRVGKNRIVVRGVDTKVTMQDFLDAVEHVRRCEIAHLRRADSANR